MLQALLGHGVVPDLIVGTSVGSINGACIAGSPTRGGVDRLATIWSGITRDDVFPIEPIQGILGILGRRSHLCSNDRLRSLLERSFVYDRLEEACVPMHVVTTNLKSGDEEVLSTGRVVDALLASSAIPGIFPPVEIDGRELMDGGVGNHTPLNVAIALGAQRVYVLHARYPWLRPQEATPLSMALLSISRLIETRLEVELDFYKDQYEILVVPSPTPIGLSPVDFSRTVELITAARRSTARWLVKRRPPRARVVTRQPMPVAQAA